MAARKTRSVQVLNLQSKTQFVDRNGRTREINEPDGKPSDKMLFALWRSGHIAVTVEPVGQLTKGEIGFALDNVNGKS